MKKIIFILALLVLLIGCAGAPTPEEEERLAMEKKAYIENIVCKIAGTNDVEFIEETYQPIKFMKPRVFDIIRIEDNFYIGHITNNEKQNNAKVSAKMHIRQYLAKVTGKNKGRDPSYDGHYIEYYNYYYLFRLTKNEYEQIIKKD